VYPFDVEGWKGVSQATQVREFQDEGLVFAENFVAPGAIAAHLPFVGDAAWELLERYNQMVIGGVLVEDSTTGSVSSLLGMAHPRYQITRHDQARFVRGVKLLGRLHFEMGAEFLVVPFENHPIVRSMDELERVCSAQSEPGSLELFTVHLMGTARMGADPESSVVDVSGQLWELPGCYVADASLFPTAIGVNPQLTIMALATRVAERVELAA
jgi:choline dehydrogenase-like flavoprotein